MSTQTVTVQELMAERPDMVESVIDLIVADSIACLVETEDYSHLRDLFIQPGEDIVEKYQQATEHLDFFAEYRQLLPLVEEVIENIGGELFNDMWQEDELATLSEVLRCFGHGTSFWDKYSLEYMDLTERPKLKITLEQPWDIATSILEKVDADYYEGATDVDFNTEDDENSKFDSWLVENYDDAGSNASDGEMWYLSKKPNEFMPVSLSILKEQYN